MVKKKKNKTTTLRVKILTLFQDMRKNCPGTHWHSLTYHKKCHLFFVVKKLPTLSVHITSMYKKDGYIKYVTK